MIKKRIGTDLFLTLAMLENGAPVDLASVKDIVVTIRREGGTRRVYTENHTVEGNLLRVQVNAAANVILGVFCISIQYDREDATSETGFVRHIHDFPSAFEIVPRSTEETGTEDLLEGGIVALGKDGAPGRDGMDAFETWKARTGAPGATLDDWTNALSAPLRDMSAEYDNGYITLKI